MGALIAGLSSLIQPALSSILSGGSTKSSNSQNSLQAFLASQSGVGATTGSGLPGLGQLMATLQQLQTSNPSQYAQVTGQISTKLQTAAQTASSNGNTNAANFLNQLATDFANASKSGQMPNIQDLSKSVSGGHHHHHFGGSSGSNANGNPNAEFTNSATTSTSSSSTTGQSLDQLLASLQNSQSASSLNPLSIIDNTLTSAGVTLS